jgi:hypothetical protein
MKKIIFFLLFAFATCLNIRAQWQQEWTSASASSLVYGGWIAFTELNDEWEYKYYIIDESTLKIMNGPYSSTPLYQYALTEAEKLAGYQIYSLGVDLTGDNNVEFYVLSYYGSGEPYRQSFKIFDITTGHILFEKNNTSLYYTYPVVWDVDADGILECTYAVYDYPNFVNYNYEVYNTGISTTVAQNGPVPVGFELKQNFPNPFNPSTTIEFELKKQSAVTLDVFDVLGRKVSTLLNKTLIPGRHQVEFNGRNLSTGTYFYQLKTNEQTKTKKMSIVK